MQLIFKNSLLIKLIHLTSSDNYITIKKLGHLCPGFLFGFFNKIRFVPLLKVYIFFFGIIQAIFSFLSEEESF